MLKKKINVNMILNFLINTIILLNFGGVVLAESPNTTINTGGLEDTLITITQILLIIGGGVCVGKIIHIGIQFVTSSAAEKSNAKMALIPLVIGAFVCFGAAWIGKFVINIIKADQPTNVLDY